MMMTPTIVFLPDVLATQLLTLVSVRMRKVLSEHFHLGPKAFHNMQETGEIAVAPVGPASKIGENNSTSISMSTVAKIPRILLQMD